MSAESERVGEITWHCSEPDGLPDVGVSLRLGVGVELWCGEITRSRWESAGPEIAALGDDGGSWLVLYGDQQAAVIGKVDFSSGRALLEHILAPLVRQSALSKARPTEGEGR